MFEAVAQRRNEFRLILVFPISIVSRVGNGDPLLYSWLGDPMERGAWWATVLGVAKVRYDSVTKPQTTVSVTSVS